jgi:hypothetical protein
MPSRIAKRVARDGFRRWGISSGGTKAEELSHGRGKSG